MKKQRVKFLGCVFAFLLFGQDWYLFSYIITVLFKLGPHYSTPSGFYMCSSFGAVTKVIDLHFLCVNDQLIMMIRVPSIMFLGAAL